MSPEFEVVRYRPEHAPGVAALQTGLWSPDPVLNLRYLEWKYLRNPWADEPRIYLAVRGETPVGMRGFCASRWEFGAPAQQVAIPLADDLVIHPEARNSGLVTRILCAALDDLAGAGFDFVFSLSAGRVTALGLLAQGWRSAGHYDALARRAPGTPWRVRLRERLARSRGVWRWARSPLLRSADERRPFRRLDGARLPEGGGIAVETRPRVAEMAALVAALGHDGRLRHVRSPEYLAWRYANPLHAYRFLYADGGQLDGYLALRAQVTGTGPMARVCIVDLEGRDAHVREALLRAAVEAGGFAELYAWAATFAPGERAALAGLGFEPADPALSARGWPCALVASPRGHPPDGWRLGAYPLLDPASWDLRMLYSMAG